MINRIKRIIKKIIFLYRCDEDTYIKYLRSRGADIGERVRIFDPRATVIDAHGNIYYSGHSRNRENYKLSNSITDGSQNLYFLKINY